MENKWFLHVPIFKYIKVSIKTIYYIKPKINKKPLTQ